jgi:hypothetical protein
VGNLFFKAQDIGHEASSSVGAGTAPQLDVAGFTDFVNKSLISVPYLT